MRFRFAFPASPLSSDAAVDVPGVAFAFGSRFLCVTAAGVATDGVVVVVAVGATFSTGGEITCFFSACAFCALGGVTSGDAAAAAAGTDMDALLTGVVVAGAAVTLGGEILAKFVGDF